jgi:hypothetical protein
MNSDRHTALRSFRETVILVIASARKEEDLPFASGFFTNKGGNCTIHYNRKTI